MLANKYNNVTESGFRIGPQAPHYNLTHHDSEAAADWLDNTFGNFKIDGGGHLSGDHLSKGALIRI